MVQCKILKSFPYSVDGINTLQATQGDDCNIPDGLVNGLTEAGYIAPAGGTKAISSAPENKMIGGADENKSTTTTETRSNDSNDGEQSIDDVRDEYRLVVNKNPFNGWGVDKLKAKIAEHKNG